jgi:hypothetical protein
MTSAGGSDSIELLKRTLYETVSLATKNNNISLRDDDPAASLFCLISDIYNATGKTVVLLIDEYDAPLISLLRTDNFSDPKHFSVDDELFSKTHRVVERFYSQIKPSENRLELVFITGVTKFPGLGIFSKITNLFDISIMTKFSTLMGFTQKELESNYIYFIDSIVKESKMQKDELLKMIRNYYNGFSFDGVARLYNPESINLYFTMQQFFNFCLKGGTQDLLKKFLHDKIITVDQF